MVYLFKLVSKSVIELILLKRLCKYSLTKLHILDDISAYNVYFV